MKYFLATILLLGGLAVTSPVSADGGLMMTPSSGPTITLQAMTDDDTEATLTALTDLVRLYSRVLGLELGIPAATRDDEGLITVIVNDAMVHDCPDTPSDTTQCVRHAGPLGVSRVDLATIPGFDYDDRFNYQLTLMRSRSTDSADMYQYHLVEISDVRFRN